ncbi:CYTH domain-containing protein [Microvirga aerophila]|uniref:CYTH domain-containing protein n=1 Tax=Microvirga aerophila TaxID=670291 RepID=UPI000DEF06E3|nr:CYTH domain-containing protein [Microvirga aerophila]
MGLEIERKFLVADDRWRNAVTYSERMLDGLIARFGESKVRVRIAGETASLTVKGPRKGLGRAEFEYEVPLSEATDMLATLCDGPLVEKTRYLVPHGDVTWQIDVHEGLLEGLILAEVELEHEDQVFARPEWIGPEVTGDPQYKKANIFAHHSKAPEHSNDLKQST